MSSCQKCRDAGDMLTEWRTRFGDKRPTSFLKRNLKRLHASCPGEAFCFCQHRVPE